mgnify:CR=1 FL=1
MTAIHLNGLLKNVKNILTSIFIAAAVEAKIKGEAATNILSKYANELVC